MKDHKVSSYIMILSILWLVIIPTTSIFAYQERYNIISSSASHNNSEYEDIILAVIYTKNHKKIYMLRAVPLKCEFYNAGSHTISNISYTVTLKKLFNNSDEVIVDEKDDISLSSWHSRPWMVRTVPPYGSGCYIAKLNIYVDGVKNTEDSCIFCGIWFKKPD